MGPVAKSYMRKGFLIYEKNGQIFNHTMRRPLVIYDFETDLFWISLYLRKIFYSFLSVHSAEYWKTRPAHCTLVVIKERGTLHFTEAKVLTMHNVGKDMYYIQLLMYAYLS